ncbi:hypothetical protein GFI10_01915 [Salmonella enterica subsp. diarizonae]|nr:hypothetical protein [Salmonella enterica subsp. diarizonae]EEE2267144.1 hypothetical protein [Salmonella enterica subsp. houtenae]
MMQSTTILDISTNNIFEIIRNHYKEHFPYCSEWDAITAINLAFKNSSYGRVVPGYFKTNDIGQVLYAGQHNHYSEEVFTKKENCQHLVNDVEALHSWLLNNGFIKDGMATEKMILTNKFIF